MESVDPLSFTFALFFVAYSFVTDGGIQLALLISNFQASKPDRLSDLIGRRRREFGCRSKVGVPI